MKRLLILVCLSSFIPLIAQSIPRVFVESQQSMPPAAAESLRVYGLLENVPVAFATKKDEADFVWTLSLDSISNAAGTMVIYSWTLMDNSTHTIIASGLEDSLARCAKGAANAMRVSWQLRIFKNTTAVADKSPNPSPSEPVPSTSQNKSGSGLGGGAGNAVSPYLVGNGVTEPIPIYEPRPAYTPEARAAKIEGILVLQVIIRKDGTIGSLKVIKGLGYGLDESAMDTIAKKWKFKPGTLKGVPVDVLANIEVTFRTKK